MQCFVTVKYIAIFAIKYIKYLYYGIKQRIFSLFKLQMNIFGFLKSLIRIPFESWFFTNLELSNANRR